MFSRLARTGDSCSELKKTLVRANSQQRSFSFGPAHEPSYVTLVMITVLFAKGSNLQCIVAVQASPGRKAITEFVHLFVLVTDGTLERI